MRWGDIGGEQINHHPVARPFDSGQSDGRRTDCLREKEEVSGVKMFGEEHGGITQQTLPNFHF